MNELPESADVLVVGLGPVGAALANLLGAQGINVLVVEKALDIFQAPRAIALDNEALRILQMCGLEEGDIDTVAIPEVRMHSPHFGFYSRAVTAGVIDGHPKLVTFYQPQLERVLRSRLAEFPNVQVALGVELISFLQDADGVRIELRAPDGKVSCVRSRYLVGADGANSIVRRQLGLDFRGKTYAEDWLVVDARKAPRAMDHIEFICDPCRPTPHMVAPGNRQRWEFKLQPGETREQMEHPDMVRRLLAPWSEGQDLDIERVAVYRFHARVADAFQKQHTFLVGDAAHITPPFVGQGLVAGLRDVANLAWKLAWVVKGTARPELLESYNRERRPHVQDMIQLAQLMGSLVMPSNPASAWLIHGLMKMLSTVPRLRDLFENLQIKPANRFRIGCFMPKARNGHLVRGGHLPQGWVRSLDDRTVALSDQALGAGFALIGFGIDPTTALSPDMRQRWRAAGGRCVQIVPRGNPARESRVATWEDLEGTFLPARVPMGWVVVVRPDKAVMHDGPASEAETLLTQVLRLFTHDQGPSASPRSSALRSSSMGF